MSKGSIVLIPFPFTDLSGQKVRPALILSSSPHSEDCVVVFISSLKPKKKLPYNLPVSASRINGLKVNSVIKIDKIATLQKHSIIGTLGTIEPTLLSLVDAKLKKLLQL